MILKYKTGDDGTDSVTTPEWLYYHRSFCSTTFTHSISKSHIFKILE